MKKIGALFTSKYAIGFGVGIASVIIGYKAYKSKKVRKAIVNLLARIKKTRDDVKFAVASIKEEAEDLCAEATEQKKSAEGGK
jgi:Tfp pilus assembly major pilin PilA